MLTCKCLTCLFAMSEVTGANLHQADSSLGLSSQWGHQQDELWGCAANRVVLSRRRHFILEHWNYFTWYRNNESRSACQMLFHFELSFLFSNSISQMGSIFTFSYKKNKTKTLSCGFMTCTFNSVILKVVSLSRSCSAPEVFKDGATFPESYTRGQQWGF